MSQGRERAEKFWNKLLDKKEDRNPHGSITLIPFKVKSIDLSSEIEITGMVDTGAVHSAIPHWVISQLALPYMGSIPMETIDGRIVLAHTYHGVIQINGRQMGTTFLLQPGTMMVIGVMNLEGLGFKVNPVAGKLEEIPIPI